jgi:saccharopine dehydrogenase-like NADP-dependent oxidoreductase
MLPRAERVAAAGILPWVDAPSDGACGDLRRVRVEAMRIVLLGCGFHGRGIAYRLATSVPGIVLSVADRDAGRASALGAKAGLPWSTVDVTDGERLRELLAGVDMVVNAVGPYHRTALGVIDAALDVGVHYVDMNDDHEVAEAVLLDPSWDERARRAGVTVLIDCGVVPGLSGMLARLASERLDRTERVSIRFAWNYNRAYPAAIQHFLRINSGAGPQYVDGRYVRMAPFEGVEDVEFREPVGRASVYFTGVPDPVAIARFIPGVEHATAKGAFYQPDANRLLRDMIRWGFTSYDAPDGAAVTPMEYLLTYLGSPQGERWFEIAREELPLAVRVEVHGRRSGRATVLGFEAHDRSRRATTTFTALAAAAVARREVGPGVMTPEAWPSPVPFMRELLADPHVGVFAWHDQESPRPLAIEDL